MAIWLENWNENLLLSIKHWKSQNEIIFCLLIFCAWVSYDINELIKFESFLTIWKLHYWRSTRTCNLLWGVLNFLWTAFIKGSPILIILVPAFGTLKVAVCTTVKLNTDLARVCSTLFMVQLALSPRTLVQASRFRSFHISLATIILSGPQLYYTVIVLCPTVVRHSMSYAINHRLSFWRVVLSLRLINYGLCITYCMTFVKLPSIKNVTSIFFSVLSSWKCLTIVLLLLRSIIIRFLIWSIKAWLCSLYLSTSPNNSFFTTLILIFVLVCFIKQVSVLKFANKIIHLVNMNFSSIFLVEHLEYLLVFLLVQIELVLVWCKKRFTLGDLLSWTAIVDTSIHQFFITN